MATKNLNANLKTMTISDLKALQADIASVLKESESKEKLETDTKTALNALSAIRTEIYALEKRAVGIVDNFSKLYPTECGMVFTIEIGCVDVTYDSNDGWSNSYQ
jgi:hypothetical protein